MIELHLRFTLAKMLLAVGLVGVACAGLMYRTRWWAESILSITLVTLVGVALVAIYRSDRTRAFCVGFVVAGAAYTAVSLSLFFQPLSSSLLTTKFIDETWLTIQPWPNLPAPADPFGAPLGPIRELPTDLLDSAWSRSATTDPANQYYVEARSFALIGHCMWTWLFAFLAGWFCIFLQQTRQRRPPPTAPVAASPFAPPTVVIAPPPKSE